MKYNRLNQRMRNFFSNQSGETAVQTSLIFSLAVILGVVFGVPMLNEASKQYAYNKQFGIDPVKIIELLSLLFNFLFKPF